MKNCVLAFDNKMCIKANKQQILDLEKDIKDNFMSRHEMEKICKKNIEEAK